MMKKFLILGMAAVGATVMTSCGQGSARLVTDVDSLSYAIGVDMGNMAYKFDSTMNPNIIANAVKEVFSKKASMTQEEAQAFIQEYMTVGLARKNKAQAEKFLMDALNSGAQQTDQGLVYKIHNPGGDRKVQVGDTIYVHYVLTLPDGQEVGRTRGEMDRFVLEPGGLIPAWIEGLPLVGEGGEITLYSPAVLAYGPGTGTFGPEQALQFEVKVIKVSPAAPKDEAAQ